MATKKVTKKSPAKAGEAKSIKDAEKELQPFLEICTEGVKDAVKRLKRAAVYNDLGYDDLYWIVMNFDISTYRGSWDEKTRAEQERWGVEFDKTLNKLYGLLESGPYHPRAFGVPIKGDAMMDLARKWLSPEALDPDQLSQIRLENSTSFVFVKWTLVDALRAYEKEAMSRAEPDQVLKKPGDKDSQRAWFLTKIQRARPDLKPKTLAKVVGCLFGAEHEPNERTIRKFKGTGKAA